LDYFYFEKTYEKKNGDAWGIAIFSRYQIMGQAQITFDHKTSNSCCYVDVDKNGTPFRIFNIHLQSIYLSAQDYRFMEDMEQYQSFDEKQVLPILSKVKQAFFYRSEQAKEIASVIQQSPYPVVVCGDLNDSPASFAYHMLSRNLTDAFLEKGTGIGATYNAFLPLYRIDYILLDPKLSVEQFKIFDSNLSDHYPVSAVIAFHKISS
jgi:endonuclease/exonuclease/phosphatase family metal-dependent hydrolase